MLGEITNELSKQLTQAGQDLKSLGAKPSANELNTFQQVTAEMDPEVASFYNTDQKIPAGAPGAKVQMTYANATPQHRPAPGARFG